MQSINLLLLHSKFNFEYMLVCNVHTTTTTIKVENTSTYSRSSWLFQFFFSTTFGPRKPLIYFLLLYSSFHIGGCCMHDIIQHVSSNISVSFIQYNDFWNSSMMFFVLAIYSFLLMIIPRFECHSLCFSQGFSSSTAKEFYVDPVYWSMLDNKLSLL